METPKIERRLHHYRFAHKYLPEMAHDLGPRMLDATPADGFGPGFVNLWDSFGARLPAGEQLPSTGLRAELIELGPHRLLVVVLPAPIAAAEAYYTAIVQPGGSDRLRYFTLEYAMNPFTGESYTVFAEWAEGSHLSYGSGPEASLSSFLQTVVEFLAKEESAPAAESESADAPTAAAPAATPAATPAGAPPAAASGSAPASAPEERRGLRKLFGR